MTELIEANRHLVQLTIDDNIHLDERFNIKHLIHLARKNDLMLAIEEKIKKVIIDDADILERYAKQEALELNSAKIMEEFLSASASNKLSVITIKTFLPLRYADNNIDIVVIGHDAMLEARNILAELGFARLRNLADIREPKKEMYYHLEYGREECTVPKLHLHNAISWNGVIYLDKQIVWKRHVMTKRVNLEIPIPSPEDELLIMAAHAIFENKFITLTEFIHFYLLTSNQDINWDYIVESATDKHWSDALLYFLANVKMIAQAMEVSVEVELNLPQVVLSDFAGLPYKLLWQSTSRVSWKKLWLDINQGLITELPRQLFSYSLVDWFWMYRKARRKTTTSEKIS